MSGRIEGGRPSVPPQVDSAEAAKTETQPETKAADQTPASSESTPAPVPQKSSGQVAEFGLSGMARAAQLQAQALPKEEPPKLPTEDVLKRNDNQKTPKPEVQELQKQVNQWRAENGKKPIKEDGFFGEKTEKAVQEFQKANGLKKDGQAGIATQNRVLLENDANFKKLDGGIKNQVRAQMTGYDQDSAKVQNLRDFASTPGLSKLSTAHQQQMLDMQKTRPDDAKFGSQLSTLANSPTFQNLNDGTKTAVLNQASGYAGDATKMDNLNKLATSPGFDKISTAHQQQMLNAQKARPDDAQLAEGLGKLAGSPAFRGASDATKTSTIDTLSNNPPLTDEKLKSTTGLIGSPAFSKLSDADKALVNDGLKGLRAQRRILSMPIM